MIVSDVIVKFSHQYTILSGKFNLHKLNNELQVDDMSWVETLQSLTKKVEELLTKKVEELSPLMNLDLLFLQMNTLKYSETQKMWLIFCFEITDGLEFNTLDPAEFGIEIQRLPNYLFQLNLKKLDISHGKIPALPSIILPKLEEMIISIQIVIPLLFAPQLKKLELHNLEIIPDMTYLSSLQELILVNCETPPEFYPPKLSYLDISGMDLDDFKLPSIQEIQINMDQLKNLPSRIIEKYFIQQDINPSGKYRNQTFQLTRLTNN